jgi:SagB-type dehydrogenase family enzyme
LFRTWGSFLPGDVEVCPVQLPGREGRLPEQAIVEMRTLIAMLLHDLLPLLDRPYALFGHSLGGLVAFELALALERAGVPSPVELFVSACRAPTLRERNPIYLLSDTQFLNAIRSMNGTACEVFEHTELVKLLLPTLRADFHLNDTYVGNADRQLSCPIHVFCWKHDAEVTAEELAGWKHHTRGVTQSTTFDGGHFFLKDRPEHVLAALDATLHERLVLCSGVQPADATVVSPTRNTMETKVLKPTLLKPSARTSDSKPAIVAVPDSRRYFWAPSVRWTRTANEVVIEIYSYGDVALRVFPEFYFAAQNGKTIQELLAGFPGENPDKLRAMILDFIRNRILVDTLQGPHEIFYSQTHLFKNPYSDDILIDPAAYERFKSDQMNRCFHGASGPRLSLPAPADYPAWLITRRSSRSFNDTTPISLDTFGRLLSTFKQSRDEHGKPIYYYASAGGLYPIDVFVHVKKGRVDGVGAGVYYYNPLENSLQFVSEAEDFTDASYQPNKVLARSSAFSLFFFYSASATMPKYGGSGYYYACLEVGLMVATLTAIAETAGIAVCSIGDLNFRRIEHCFKLETGQVYLHLLELGRKNPS